MRNKRKENGTASISWWDNADISPDPCVRCGARVAVHKHLGGVLEAEVTEKRCLRCRNNQED